MARQKLGQHFLVSSKILDRIAIAACGEGADFVLEIGPGRGALTEKLLPRASRMAAIELDYELAAFLREKWAGEPKLQIVEGNALSADWTAWGEGVLVGNLPYYVASAIITSYVLRPGALRHGVFLIQREVAERIAATPGNREYGYLSVLCQFFAEVKLLFSVPPGAFHPPPKVDSAVIRVTPRADVPEVDRERFVRFISECFQHKRKTLRNNLLEWAPRDVIEAAGGMDRRGEQLSPTDFLDLYRKLEMPSQVVEAAAPGDEPN
ncbi:MAG: dimethyladenosine transferase [Bryobacterales bacterium]|nr:dimethyladenosine transferase [Bryobacterales bacterium]